MSEAKFTKGEWVAKDNGYYFDIHEVDSRGYYLDQVCMGVSYENKDNVPIISAAPEMYEMLEKIHDSMAGNGEYGEFYYDVKELLAKARGEHD